ncbi:hypothetical protein LUZ61_002637 [Rhynchospora tenuis]|uniref:Uncharacterized protein n=1 Tax=Rhynchospora tenuis TaxID=198213 RepID=A0AAD5ZJ93_9POAL|nr:hypothetical protein LUZ61_002637 [Rhynchospora tenuis]
MGNCVVIQRETTWLNEEEDDWEFSERSSLRETETTTEVKIRITKKQLEELLNSSKLPLEKVLEEIVNNGVVCHEHNKEGHWKPRLQSIPEVIEER